MPLNVKKYSADSYAHQKEVLRKIDNVSDRVMDSISAIFKPVYYPRQTVFLKGDHKREFLFFLHKGLVRLYYKKAGKEINESFETEGSFFGFDYTRTADHDMHHYMETLEDTWMLAAKLSDLEELMRMNPQVEHLARIFLERKYVRLSKHMLEIKSLTAKERYKSFMDNYPKLAQRLPMKHIANYLGVKGETISRIRANYP